MPTDAPRPPARLHDGTGTLAFPEFALVDALAAMTAAGTSLDVAEAVCACVLEVEGVRAAAVLRRRGRAAVVVGSAGYGCDTMGAGSRVPLDSGLPAAEAIRTGMPVCQGQGPGWCAMPFGRRTTAPGALLLSLTSAAPSADGDLERLQRLATAVGAALVRADRSDRRAADLAAVLAGLNPAPATDTDDVAVRQTARGGDLGGDVALALPDSRGGRWLVVADVSGAGLAAASRAAAVRMAVRALAPSADGPAQLLALLDRALRPETPEGAFVTAVVVHAADGRLRVATAGHPAPLLLDGRGVQVPPVEPGQPLALETTRALPELAELELDVAADALLVLYSDGLTDRRGEAGAELDAALLLADAGVSANPAEVADALVAAADAVGPADDDTSVLVSRV